VVLANGDTVTARAVLVATDAAAAANLCGTVEPAWHGVTTFYHAAPSPPRDDALLLVDADEPLIRNTVVLSAAAASYAPPGASLIATSVLDTATPVTEIEPAVRSRLAVIYGPAARTWDLLATYRVPHALPAMTAPHPLRRRVRLRGVYVCGDHRDTSSIQGALVSGRRAADAILTDLL
jgi:predicted NAD/FAD-dependent oxidoreductase